MVSTLFKLSLAVFIACNLLDLGLRLNPKDVRSGLANRNFTGHVLFWGFIISPAVAMIITTLLPVESPYATGLILLSLTPGAPFLPMVLRKANVDLGYTAAFMVVVAGATVIVMPVLLPLMLPGLAITSWAIAQPLIAVMLIPFCMGMFFLYFYPDVAYGIQRTIKHITTLFAILTFALCVMVYGEGVLEINPGWAFSSLFLFFFLITALPAWFGFGLAQDQKLVLSMGLATRNLGASIAPLLLLEQLDQRSIIMVGLGLPFMLLFSWLSMKWFNRYNQLSKTAA
jgi:bile acid:Na+ symporter, BASS family